jgi:hypothetical protein
MYARFRSLVLISQYIKTGSIWGLALIGNFDLVQTRPFLHLLEPHQTFAPFKPRKCMLDFDIQGSRSQKSHDECRLHKDANGIEFGFDRDLVARF